MGRFGPRMRRVSAFNSAAGQDIVGLAGVDGPGPVGPAPPEMPWRAGSGSQTIGRSAATTDSTASRDPDQRQHRLAAMADETFREHRLVLEVGIDAEGIFAGHIKGRENADDAGIAFRNGARSPMENSRWHGARGPPSTKGRRRGRVVAVAGRARHLGMAVDAEHAVPDRLYTAVPVL